MSETWWKLRWEEKNQELNQRFEGLYKLIKDVLGDKGEKVIVFYSIFNSLCYLVTDEYG